jgi:hypothetical protein
MLRLCLAIFLLIPTPALADHVPTQTPYDISIACDADGDTTKGDITVTWQESDGFEDSPPERYAIAFSNDNFVESNYAVANSTGWEEALSYKSYVFTASYRETIFGTTADTFYAKVRADNDTDASYSEWTGIVSIDCDYGSTPTTTTTVPPAVPDDATNVSVNYQGKDVYFAWEYTDGNTVVNEFHINYSYDNSIWDRVIVTDTTARTYTLDYTNIQTGTFYWTFSVCGDIENGESCTDSDSNNFETTQYVAPTTTVYVAPPPPPPPPPPTPEEIIVDVKVEGVDKTYTQADVNDGTIERDQERIDNEDKFGCFMTNAQIERGDCDIPEPIEEDIKNDIIEEDVVIKEDIVEDKKDVDVIIPEDDVVVLDPPKEETIKDEVVEFEEPPIEFEIIEFDMEDIAPEIVVEVPILVEDVEDEPIKEDIPEVLEKDTPDTTLPTVEIKPKREDIVLTEEEVAVEVAEVVEIIEDIIVEEATVEEVVEILEEVNDIGVQNLSSVTEETQDVIQEVVEEAIADVAELTEKQVEIVAEVLQVEAEDVAIIAESVKDDEVIAEAVEEYVERAVANADVENYTLADVVTEVQFETFIDNPIQTFIDIDIQEINFSDIGNDMTNDQKEKAQEVVVPVILTRIATMAAFIFRRGNV